ncbi:MAG TPA: TRCF domain-containing protein, partial [Arenibaculum sp.]|nr:TRCF domain-containing protein [Arenibaculum sp.]
VTAEAARRLAEVAAHEEPGTGFALATSDLDLRGAGNLVGEEQSGHLRDVGAELFQDLLRRAVGAVRTGREPEAFWTPRVNFGLPVLIPETYVADPGERMTLYRAIANLEGDDAAEAFADELAERHGPPPPELSNMLEIAGFKRLCRNAGVEELDIGPKGVLVGFRYEPDLSGFLKEHPDARRRPDGRLSVPVAAGGCRAGEGAGEASKEGFEGVRRLLCTLAGLPAGMRGRHSVAERRAAS